MGGYVPVYGLSTMDWPVPRLARTMHPIGHDGTATGMASSVVASGMSTTVLVRRTKKKLS